jgi:hypothetical protein
MNGSVNSTGTAGTEDIEMADHTDVLAALNAGVQRVSLVVAVSNVKSA